MSSDRFNLLTGKYSSIKHFNNGFGIVHYRVLAGPAFHTKKTKSPLNKGFVIK